MSRWDFRCRGCPFRVVSGSKASLDVSNPFRKFRSHHNRNFFDVSIFRSRFFRSVPGVVNISTQSNVKMHTGSLPELWNFASHICRASRLWRRTHVLSGGWHLLSAATAECGKVLPSMVQDGGTWAWHGKHGLETTLDYSTTYETVMFAGLRIYDLVSM